MIKPIENLSNITISGAGSPGIKNFDPALICQSINNSIVKAIWINFISSVVVLVVVYPLLWNWYYTKILTPKQFTYIMLFIFAAFVYQSMQLLRWLY